MKKILTFIFIICVICVPMSVQAKTLNADTEADTQESISSVDTEIVSEESINSKYGNVYLSITSGELSTLGFEYADLVSVTFMGQTLILPIVPTYRYVGSQCAALLMPEEKEKRVELDMFNTDFANSYGLSKVITDEDGNVSREVPEGVQYPIDVTIKMEEKGGYADEYILFELERTNERSDYLDLSDEEFANFRMIATTGIEKDRLYRSSSPINPAYGRNKYADHAAEMAGVKSVVNLADYKESAFSYERYADTYYSKQNIIFLNLGQDFSTDYNREGVAKAMEFIADAEPPVLVHCHEGQDRAGFVSAVLECLMGASFEEVREDYMISFYNYYGVEPETEQYDHIAVNIERVLCTQFGLDSLVGADLKQAAEDYLEGIGVTEERIEAVREKLG